MLAFSQITSSSPNRLYRPALPGPGIEGDYFEINDEEILIQKLNVLFHSQNTSIPPLLPDRTPSDATLDTFDTTTFNTNDNDDEHVFFCPQTPNDNKKLDQKDVVTSTTSLVQYNQCSGIKTVKPPSSSTNSSMSPRSVASFASPISPKTTTSAETIKRGSISIKRNQKKQLQRKQDYQQDISDDDENDVKNCDESTQSNNIHISQLKSRVQEIRNKKDYISMKPQQQHPTLLSEKEGLKQFIYFTAEGDFLLSRIICERSRIELKRDMLKNELDLYVFVSRRNKNESHNANEDRRILFCC